MAAAPRVFRRRTFAALGLSLGVALWPAVLGTSITRTLFDVSQRFAAALPVGPLLGLIDGKQAISTGSDGRLTILLLGSDTRGSGIQRTDTIMIASIKNNVISAASIPRDTARIPNPSGGYFNGRINALVKQFRAAGLSNAQALERFEQVIENLVGIEIDYYALVKFNGFNSLVDEVDPIPVRIGHAIRDGRFWDDPDKPSGVYFPASNSYDLFAWQPNADPPLCNGLWKSQSEPIGAQFWCRRAMPFVRSRKGPGNSDFVRARRQQDFVIAAIRRVTSRSTSQLESLRSRAQGQVGAGQLITDIPLTTGNALELYQTLNGASVGFQVVFSPSTYATHISGTTAYELKLDAVRQVGRQWFGGGAPPTPEPTGSASPTSNTSPFPTSITSPLPTSSTSPLPTSSTSPGPTGTAGSSPATIGPSTSPAGPTASAGSPDGSGGPIPSGQSSGSPATGPTGSAAASSSTNPLPGGSGSPDGSGQLPGQSPEGSNSGAATAGIDPAVLGVVAVLAVAAVGAIALSWLRLRPRL